MLCGSTAFSCGKASDGIAGASVRQGVRLGR
uniref:Uncharacterized protein n=1 Tax=Neisseria meningitidis alpha522 TaxID=996307 RepID=I4E6B1_NEIME|nr:hypothetical protein NMALPHA522_1338 [Neisseria meningitidis alpha522]